MNPEGKASEIFFRQLIMADDDCTFCFVTNHTTLGGGLLLSIFKGVASKIVVLEPRL